jgi:hypothetical protein
MKTCLKINYLNVDRFFSPQYFNFRSLNLKHFITFDLTFFDKHLGIPLTWHFQQITYTQFPNYACNYLDIIKCLTIDRYPKVFPMNMAMPINSVHRPSQMEVLEQTTGILLTFSTPQYLNTFFVFRECISDLRPLKDDHANNRYRYKLSSST